MCVAFGGKSALDGAGHDACVKVLLEEGVHDNQRQAGDDDGGVLQQLGQLGTLSGALDVGDHAGLRLALDQDGTKHQLQGLLGGVVQVDHGVEVAVPHGHELPQGQDRHHRHAHRQQDLEEVEHFAGAVHVRGLPQVIGDALVVGAGDDHVPDAEGAGQDDGPHGIQQAQVVDQQVSGDQAAVEEHGDDEQGVEDFLALEVGQGHGVGCQHGDSHRNKGKQQRIDNGVFKAGPDLGVGCDPLVSGEGPLAEVEGDALVLECHRIHEGCEDNIHHRHHNCNHK